MTFLWQMLAAYNAYLFIGQADVLQDASEMEFLDGKFPETKKNSQFIIHLWAGKKLEFLRVRPDDVLLCFAGSEVSEQDICPKGQSIHILCCCGENLPCFNQSSTAGLRLAWSLQRSSHHYSPTHVPLQMISSGRENKLLLGRVAAYLNVRDSHQGQQLLTLIIMLPCDFHQTFCEFFNIFLLPWVETNRHCRNWQYRTQV